MGGGVDLSGKENLILATVDLDNSVCCEIESK